MKKAFYILLLGTALLLAGLFTGCKTIKQDKHVNEKHNKSDSVNVFESVKQEVKTASIKSDSTQNEIKTITYTVTGECKLQHCSELKDTVIKNTSGRATLTTEIKKGVIKNKCVCDTASIQYIIESRFRSEFKQGLKADSISEKETIVKEVTVYPNWLKWLAGIGVASILYWLYRIYKIFFKKAI